MEEAKHKDWTVENTLHGIMYRTCFVTLACAYDIETLQCKQGEIKVVS
jgi:hypothetical protein